MLHYQWPSLIVLEGLWQCAEHTGRSGVLKWQGSRIWVLELYLATHLLWNLGKYMKFSDPHFFHLGTGNKNIYCMKPTRVLKRMNENVWHGAEHPVSRCLLNAAGDIAPCPQIPPTHYFHHPEGELGSVPAPWAWCFLPVYFLNHHLLSSYEESGSERGAGNVMKRCSIQRRGEHAAKQHREVEVGEEVLRVERAQDHPPAGLQIKTPDLWTCY